MSSRSFDTPPASVCILRLSAIGDTCHVLPVVRTLQRACPIRGSPGSSDVEAKLLGHIPDIEFIVLDKQSPAGSYRLLREQMRGRIRRPDACSWRCAPACSRRWYRPGSARLIAGGRASLWLFTRIASRPPNAST
jgi:hypothetical protein